MYITWKKDTLNPPTSSTLNNVSFGVLTTEKAMGTVPIAISVAKTPKDTLVRWPKKSTLGGGYGQPDLGSCRIAAHAAPTRVLELLRSN